MTTLDNALALAARGFPVFPIKAGGKAPPLWKKWPLQATAYADKIRTYFPEDANIGIHCKGLVVLDIDVRSGGDESLAKLELLHDLPPTLTTITPTGGRHLFYRLPEGHPGVPNGANKLGPGIDIKSTNGYVLAPGSEVPAGRYKFEADVPIADAPEWLVQELGTFTPREQKETVDVPDASMEVTDRAMLWLQKQPIGDGAFKTACGLRDFGLSQEQALGLLLIHDGRSESVLRPKVEHAYRYAQNDPGSKAASAEDFPVIIPAPAKPRQKLMRLDELAKQPPGPYLVKGMLQRHSHAVMYGAPGEGKTFVALDLAYHVACGLPWQERRVHQGPVLYLAYEGIGGLAKRAAALGKKYEDAEVPLYIVAADYNLRDVAGRKALAEDLAQLPEKPVLVVIDTLARAMKGGDENSAQDMGALNDAVSALIQATGACVLLVHHSGKNKDNGARGSSALLGAIDTEIQVDSRQIFSRKQRDVEPAPPLGFKLTPTCVGEDSDGDEIMSCYVEPAVPIVERTAGLPENARLVFDTLDDLAKNNDPVPKETLYAKCIDFLPERESSARKAFSRALLRLKQKNLIEEDAHGNYQRRLE